MEDNQELDPEIAELLGIDEGEIGSIAETQPDIGPISAKPIPHKDILPIDIKKLLSDKEYYSEIMTESKEYGKRVHDLFGNFAKTDEKDEKSMYREKLIPAYWNMLSYLIGNFFEALTDKKQSMFRYGLLSPTFIDDVQKDILLQINESPSAGEGFYYVDEWLLAVGNGNIKQSSVDETIKAKKKTPSAMRDRLDRKMGSLDAEIANLKQKIEQHLMIEKSLKSSVSILLDHEKVSKYRDAIVPYTTEQKKTIVQIQDILKNLQKSDKQLEASYQTLNSLDGEIKSLKDQSGDLADEVDTRTVSDEFGVIRQMIKMTVGRQGNHFPFLIKTYMPRFEKDICSKENLQNTLQEIEKIDPGIFKRSYKQKEHRIVPHFIIVPCYGDSGICWEPFDRMNKATGRGRMAIPMFPRSLKTAVLYALGDMRWQIAKEKALHYWMEEGLTGYYYEYTQKNKLKGDLKEYFIQDYILWVQYEAQGIQKLTKEVRAIFWRYIPFPQSIKESLKDRGYYYAELYKKDKNIEVSRGY
ncbi:MAG: hypothetical protein JSV25_06575 [Spirochaetota bacterium]|nr:MAG: hypothetical protein JSV25_06575 [Spirochaetota bacterium]